ncbi:MAG TPA: type ISP restriction/modification enzyme, partial [Terriglobales bacterium]|nr:type ISP restriction/modification enzyme [Terriglobales bacterium]
PYVKAIRWASDRIKEEGVVALVTNSGFVDGIATDGMRAHLVSDFDEIFILDLGGNVRKNPKLSGTTHNVFGIQVGVSINLFVRRNILKEQRICKIYYAKCETGWTRWQKYDWLEQIDRISGTQWSPLAPDAANRWLSEGSSQGFENFVSIEAIFEKQSRGIATSRDAWAYNFNRDSVSENIQKTMAFYNDEVGRWQGRSASDPEPDIDKFVRCDDTSIGWSRDLKQDLQRERRATFSESKIRKSLYRPFARLAVFFDRVLNEEVYVFPSFLPTEATEAENILVCLTGPGSEKPFLALAAHQLVDLHLSGAGCSTQCFPFYTYAEDGTHRRENITDWALEQFPARYGDRSITKWDICHYIYAVLHHPEYRERYAANLRRELPRIPFTSATPSIDCHPEERSDEGSAVRGAAKMQIPRSARDDNAERVSASSASSAVQDLDVFRQQVKAGRCLAEIQVHYESQPEYALTKTEKPGKQLDWRVSKMRLSKNKTTLIYNDFLTLSGIPPAAYEYRLGNRSALEWVVDQYQVSTDKRSGTTNDPNRADDQEYIVRLIGRVISVSPETVKIVNNLPSLGIQ